MPSLVAWNLLNGSGEGNFSYYINGFLLFHYYLPFENDKDLSLNKFESQSFKEAFRKFWLKLTQCLWRIVCPWKRAGPSIWKKNLVSLYPRMLCAKGFKRSPSIEQTWIPLNKDMFGCHREEDENVKSLQRQRRRQRTTDTW